MRNVLGCSLHKNMSGVTNRALFHAYDCDPCLQILLKSLEPYYFGDGLLSTALKIFMKIARKKDQDASFAARCNRVRMLRKTYKVIARTITDFKHDSVSK